MTIDILPCQVLMKNGKEATATKRNGDGFVRGFFINEKAKQQHVCWREHNLSGLDDEFTIVKVILPEPVVEVAEVAEAVEGKSEGESNDTANDRRDDNDSDGGNAEGSAEAKPAVAPAAASRRRTTADTDSAADSKVPAAATKRARNRK